jgi:hypothetical protein
MRWLKRFFTLSLLAASAFSCHSEPSPSPLNLTGTWSGRLGESGSGSALRVTWVATQAGTAVSGSATLVKPSLNVPATGTMTGTLSGNQLTLNYSVPAGAVPVYLSCTVAASGSAMATSQTISGTLETTFTFCLGSGLESPESAQLTLTKQ